MGATTALQIYLMSKKKASDKLILQLLAWLSEEISLRFVFPLSN